MAARAVAAASGSPPRCCFCVFFFLFVAYLTDYCRAKLQYSQLELYNIGYNCQIPITIDYQRSNNIPPEITRPTDALWNVVGSVKRRRRRKERKQKRGCRSGQLTRLRRHPFKPALPSIFLTNARSIVNKIDEVEALLAGNLFVRDCCVLAVMETWLREDIPDASVQLASRTMHRSDRIALAGKSKGGGLCIYIHNDWCMNSKIVTTVCSPDIEAMSVM